MKIANIIIIGVILGIISAFWPTAILVLGLLVLCLWSIKKYTGTESRKFLLGIFLAGFILRVIFSFSNYYIAEYAGMGADTQPDARVYNSNALYIASIVTGNAYVNEIKRDAILEREIDAARKVNNGGLPNLRDYQVGFYVYIIGCIYALLGYAPVAVKIINGLAGCMIAVMTYFAAKLLVRSEIAAKISAGIMMFLPSTLYWSVTLLRDTIANLLFLSYTIMFLAYFKNDNKRTYLITSLILAVALGLFKERLAVFMTAGFILVLAVKLTRETLKVRLRTILAPAVIILTVLIFMNYDFICNKIAIIMGIQFSSSKDPAVAAYSLYDDVIKEGGALNLKFLLIGLKALAYYFLSPFPWYVPYSHGLLLMFYPQVILTFLCIPFVIIGIVASLRRDLLLTLMTLSVLAFVVVPQAMTEAVIGSVVRHRDMFTPFISVFLSYGLCLVALPSRNGRKGSGALA